MVFSAKTLYLFGALWKENIYVLVVDYNKKAREFSRG